MHSFKITVNTWTGNEKQNKAKSPLPALQTSDTGGQKTDMKAFFGVLGVQLSDDSSEAEEESSEDEDSDTSSQASSHASNMTQPKKSYVAYVGQSLPDGITTGNIYNHFQAIHGSIKPISVRVFYAKNKNRIAKISFTSPEALARAISQYNNTVLNGYTISVQKWGERPSKPISPAKSDDSSEAEEESSEDEDSDTSSQASSHASNMTQPKKSYVAYVGQSLPDGITTGNIYNHFQAIHGSIKPISVRVFYAKNKNRIAKISFTSPEALARAISQYNNTVLNGYTISVQKWGERPSKPISPAKSDDSSEAEEESSEDEDSDTSSQASSHASSMTQSKESSSGKTDPTEATVIPSSQDGWPTAYIGYNLPETISVSNLESHFNSIKSRILPDSVKIHTTKKNTRFGKIAFFSSDFLEEAISQFNKTKIKGYVIVVKKWNSAESNRDPKTESDTLMPHPSSSHPSGPHPSGPYPSGPHLSGPYPSGPHPSRPYPSGPHPSGPHPSGPHLSGPYHSRPHPSGPLLSGPYPSGPHPSGPYHSRPHPSGPHPSGPHPSGPHPSGPHPLPPAYPNYDPPPAYDDSFHSHHVGQIQGAQGQYPPLQGQFSGPQGQYPVPRVPPTGPTRPMFAQSPQNRLQGSHYPGSGFQPPPDFHSFPSSQRPASPLGQFPQGTIHSQSPTDPQHSNKKEKSNNRFKNTAKKPKGFGRHDPGLAVIIRNINPNISEDQLADIIKEFLPKVESVFLHECQNKPNYAHVNCLTEQDARLLMDGINGREYSGLCVLASLQKGEARRPLKADEASDTASNYSESSASSRKQFPQGTIHSQSPIDPQHSNKKEKSNNRFKNTASKPKGPSRHDPSLAVIIRNINPNISEDQLADIIKEFLPKVESVFLHECQNKPNYAHVNCLTEQDARLLMDGINGREYSGLCVLASLQKGEARRPLKADEASDTASNYSESSASSRKQFTKGGSSVSVKIHNLGKSISVTRLNKEIQGISGVLFTKIITTKYTYNIAYVNCTSWEAANNVAKHLSGRDLGGVRIRTQILTKASPRVSSPTRNISERFTKAKQMSEWLYKFFMERFEREIREAMEKGLTLDFKDEILLVGGSDDLVDPFFDNYISQVSDVSLSLTASQWNQLVTVKEETGQSLYQDLLRPYKGNPNIHIEKRESPFTLIIVGVQVAVESARECFMEKLDKKIAVDR